MELKLPLKSEMISDDGKIRYRIYDADGHAVVVLRRKCVVDQIIRAVNGEAEKDGIIRDLTKQVNRLENALLEEI